jgi:hypothetical protein
MILLSRFDRLRHAAGGAALAGLLALTVAAAPPAPPAPPPTYADLADLADAADLVVHAVVAKQVTVPPDRARGLAPGHARLYLEAKTRAVIAGKVPMGGVVRYLADVPLGTNGKPAKLKKREVLLFARPVPGRPDELQLIGPAAQVAFDPAIAARLRPILAELAGPDAAPAITGVRDALSVPGTLVGESETQIFLATAGGDPVSITVVRRPGMAPAWGVSFSEIVDQAARPPARDTLAWYRLACFLPPQLPARANLAQDSGSRARASEDYALVIRELGSCPRTLRQQ